MKEIRSKSFKNGKVYLLETEDGYPVEVTDTFLPYYTKDAIGKKQNDLSSEDCGNRLERWMIGVSCMSGCPVGCKFCATGMLKKWRKLTRFEMLEQVEFVLSKNPEYNFSSAKEHKINYTRMGEPFLNVEEVKEAISFIDKLFPQTHHYVSTIGVDPSDFTWIKDNITLQISVHSLDENKRNWLIPFKKKLNYHTLGKIRTGSNLKTTVNMTLVDCDDFNIEKLKRLFPKEHFFVKLSPINKNEYSEHNGLGDGIVQGVNLT